MIKARDIAEVLRAMAPERYAYDFDNVGFLVGSEDKEIHKVYLCLDVDEETAKEAASLSADMIISHHPVIFHAEKSLTDKTPLGRTLRILVQNDIAVYSAHTNLDIAYGGLNDYEAKLLGLEIIGELDTHSGDDHVCGRVCSTNQSLLDLVKLVKDTYNLQCIRYSGDLDRKINTVAICTGGGRSMISDCIKRNADVYITGDLSYSDIRDLHFNGIDYIELSHYDSEIKVMQCLREVLRSKFKELPIVNSTQKNIINYY
ncbi:MAG: Nif3-like dinuclear metal center hexameric protein [Bacillota bacterium]|nr:Nif3-like dinuclear metal center hexameric protein [Bacillota bacterium]